MYKVLSLGVLILSLFLLLSCSESSTKSSASGGSSQNKPTVSVTIGPDGMKWSSLDPKVPVLSDPVFDGTNFIALGFEKLTSPAGLTGFSDGTSDAYIYESTDGTLWQKTFTVKNAGQQGVFNSWEKNDDNDLVVLGDQAYLRTYDVRYSFTDGKILKRKARGDWQINTANLPSIADFELVGPDKSAKGPYYSKDGFLLHSLSSELKDRVALSYDPTGEFKVAGAPSLNYTHFFLSNNKLFRVLVGYTDYDEAKGGSSHRVLLFQAPVGEKNFKTVPNFPSFIEPPKGALASLSSRLAIASNEKDAYLIGVGSGFLNPNQDSSGYGPRFYKSSDAENWTEIDALSRFSKHISLTKDSTDNVYELGGVSYVKGLFVLFIIERYYYLSKYLQPSSGTTYQTDSHTTACHIVTSKDLIKFTTMTYPNVNCERAKAFYSGGKYIFTVKLEDGRALRGNQIAEQIFRLGIITAEPPAP